jgi:hypothetical protein
MRSISNLFRSIANLAGSINNLAGLIDTFAGRLRMQLALDLDESPTVLDHQSAGGENGALDGGTNGTGKGRKSRADV